PWLLEHRELVVRFIRAWAGATDWLLKAENREETLKLSMDQEKLNRKAAEIAYFKVVPRARINPAAIETVIEFRKEMGVYKPPYAPAQRFFDESYWREATSSA